ncbi:alpha-ketoacid dehydrogenase kinase [Mycena floridula]|nr:alpha-ketoacid dehydrogenase kinase [Mycena floridula]
MQWSSILRPCANNTRRWHLQQARHESSGRYFYQNRQLELYASKEAKRLTLRQLVFFGRAMDEERLVKSANYVREELPIRLAHRIRDLQALPFVVVTQEGVAKVYEMYWDAFERFRRFPPVRTTADNEAFCEFLKGILAEHSTVIPQLSLGLSLSSPYLPPEKLDSFMHRMLVSRISRRVLAEHHIALSELYSGKKHGDPTGEPHVGIIFTGLNVKRSIEKCARLLRQRPADIDLDTPTRGSGGPGSWPRIIVDGHVETKFAYVREHVEYMVFELLKNSMRATKLMHRASELPPIRATIAEGANDVSIRISDQGGGLWNSENQIQSPSDLFSFSHTRNPLRLERSRIGALRQLSSTDGGMRGTVDEQLNRWKKAQKDPETDAGVGAHPRFGIGLPMSNIFATYFGGSLQLVSMDAWGTDAYLRLPKLGTNLEGVEV